MSPGTQNDQERIMGISVGVHPSWKIHLPELDYFLVYQKCGDMVDHISRGYTDVGVFLSILRKGGGAIEIFKG